LVLFVLAGSSCLDSISRSNKALLLVSKKKRKAGRLQK
jgi:hypothetical protein